MADELGIPRERIVFTCFEWKDTFFENNKDFVWHLDDNPMEFKTIQQLGIAAINVKSPSWQRKCSKLIENKLYGRFNQSSPDISKI